VADRVAWAYLASLLAAVVAGLLVVVVDQAVVPWACPAPGNTLEDAAAVCQLAWAVSTALLGFVVALAPILRLLKQDGWLWLAFVPLTAAWVMVDAVADWWWWAGLALVPAMAALVSAPWGHGRSVQRGALVAAVVLAVVGLAWWYVRA